MEAQLLRTLYSIVGEVWCRRRGGGRRFPDAVIVLTLMLAAFNHRPISWATQRRNWPIWMQRWYRRVPTSTTMSRRLRTESVREFLDAVLERAQRDLPVGLCLVMDGKPLVIGGGSKDQQAGYGRAVGGKAKGYKLHSVQDLRGRIVAWRVAPMNVSEQRMGLRLLSQSSGSAYILADGNYDSNLLHAAAQSAGMQLVTPRRYAGRGLGRRPQRSARLRSIDLVEGPSGFGADLLAARDAIERHFGNLTSFSAGLGPLPAWVRTHRRVRLWVHAKLIINAVRITRSRAAA